MPYCLGCGSMIDEWDSAYYARNMFCIPCYNRKMSEVPMATCNKCGMRIRQDQSRSMRGGTYCSFCYSELERLGRLPTCYHCQKKIELYERMVKTSDGRAIHESCAQKERGKVNAICSYCGEQTSHFKISRDGSVMCSRCSSKETRDPGGILRSPAKPRGLFASIANILLR